MYKRILALFLVALTLIFSIPLTSLAEEETPEFAWADLDKTTIKEDLKDFDFSSYKKDSSILNPSIITVAEKGFSANMDYTKCALYLYIYIPMADKINLKSVLNKVQINNGKYSLVYVGKEGEAVFKYKVNAPVSFFEKLNTKSRVYDIASLEFGLASNLPTPKDYKIGGKYTFEGLDGNVSLKSVETFEVVRLDDIKYTTFRNTSSLGADYRNQLTSVYFSIPNYILKRYDYKFYGIDCTYEKYYTKPMVVTQSNEVYNELKEMKADSLYRNEVTLFGGYKNYYYYNSEFALSLYGCDAKNISNHAYYTYYFAFNKSYNFLTGIQLSTDAYVFHNPSYLPIYFLDTRAFDSDFYISADRVSEKIESFYLTSDKDKHYLIDGLDYYHEHLFEDYYLEQDGTKISIGVKADDYAISGEISGKFNKAITIDDVPYDMKSYSSSTHWLKKLDDFGLKVFITGLKNDVSYNVKPVEELPFSSATNDEYSIEYLIDKNEVATVRKDIEDAKNRGETTYIFRLDVAPYFSFPVEAKIDSKSVDGDTYVFQEPVYMGFDVLDLLFKDENGEIVKVAVSSDPENAIGGSEPPLSDIVEEEYKKWWENLKNTMGNIFSIMFLLIIVSIAIAFFPTIRDFLASLIDGLATGIDGAIRPNYTGNESKKRKRRKRK